VIAMVVGRNEPCPCGSGRKYKRCCLRSQNSPRSLADPFLSAADVEDPGYEQDERVTNVARALAVVVAEAGNAGLERAERDFLAQNPKLLVVFLDGFIEIGGEPGDEREALAEAYYFLMGLELSLLRINLDHGFPWAQRLRDRFEQKIIDAVRAGEAQAEQLSAITELMVKEGIPPQPALAAVCEEAFADQADGIEADPAAMCASLVAECNADPFLIRDTLYSTLTASGASSRELIAVLLTAPQPAMREGAALGVLDRDAAVRSATAAALAQATESVSPATLRRLIAIRRWLPEAERSAIDQAVRAARLGGVQCAQWGRGAGIIEIRASSPDGAGAQMAMVVSAAAGKHRLSAILFKRGAGVVDAWTGEPQLIREISAMLNEQSPGVQLLRVSRRYLDLMVGYYLADGLKHAAAPPAHLLELAELLQAPQWQPAESSWRELLAQMKAQVRTQLLTPVSVNTIIATSGKWGAHWQQSGAWAEAGKDVERLLDRAEGRPVKEVCHKIIDRISEKRREAWTERFALTALWMKESPRRTALPWEQFTIVAQKLAEGLPMRKLPLMQRIAEATIFM
jgi:hypothetical protein